MVELMRYVAGQWQEQLLKLVQTFQLNMLVTKRTYLPIIILIKGLQVAIILELQL